ncbi:MAG: phosphomannose isomerase type II C-terminal cupin domain [Patescibacteria group bacterium]|nr:phosphomannose isomerase type II C-terminal cupin domain [Patescibacteria group bacterium]
MENKTILKPWGKYIILEKKPSFWIKKLFVYQGARLSLQSHKNRSEFWIVLSGEIEVVKGKSNFKLRPGEFLNIKENEKHRITGRKDSWILEAAFGQVRENDIIRFKDDYGRIKSRKKPRSLC